MFEEIRILIALVGSLIGGLWDLKTTNIPDFLVFSMVITGFIINFAEGFLTGNYSNLTGALLYGGIFLAFGLLMYYFGQWGGGDGGLLVAIAVLLPTLPATVSLTSFPFSVSFFINTIFIGVAYSVVYSLIFTWKNQKVKHEFFQRIKKRENYLPMIFILILSLFFLAISRTIFYLSLLLLALSVLQVFAKSISEGFYRKIPVSKLKTDDMIGEDIPNLKIYKKFIRGLTKDEIKKIKKMKKFVIIREGVRYGMVFPLSLLYTLLLGDLILLFF